MATLYAETTVRPRFVVAVEWLARHPDPAAATFRDVEDWLRDRGLSASSTLALRGKLRAFYVWMQREGLSVADPTQLVKLRPVPKPRPRPTPEQAVSALARTGNVQLRALFVLMACAGLRCCECSRLDWRDVDLATGHLIVSGKGSRERDLYVSPDVVRALAALRLGSTARVGAVFVGPSGRRLAPYRVSQLVNTSIHAAGYGDTSAHKLRHRFATAAYAASGGDLLVVRDLCGHSSVATTEIYAAGVPGRQAAVSRSLAVPA
jgi:integrase/recombinase XerC